MRFAARKSTLHPNASFTVVPKDYAILESKMDGIVLINKPAGWTSFDVVAKVRNVLRTELRNEKRENRGGNNPLNPQISIQNSSPKVKVGHTGTLDPLATGLLIIVTGTYCKRAQEFSKLDKVYETELILGTTSVTDDGEGEKTKTSAKMPSEGEVREVLNTFVGVTLQQPPAFSAIKVDGKRAYKLVREGKAVIIEPRPVTVYQISDIKYSYPAVRFTARVSSGTYIRSLARDTGEKLGTGAYMSSLKRTEVGNYKLADAIDVADFSLQDIRQI